MTHEYVHAITWEQFKGLYGGSTEARALNEAISDIFASIVEYEEGSAHNWLFGDVNGANITRNLRDPKSVEQNYQDDLNDPIDVNISGPSDPALQRVAYYQSTALSHAAYLMSEGGSHNGEVVGAIGRRRTSHVFFRAYNCLTNTTRIQDAGDCIRRSAQDLAANPPSGTDFTVGDAAGRRRSAPRGAIHPMIRSFPSVRALAVVTSIVVVACGGSADSDPAPPPDEMATILAEQVEERIDVFHLLGRPQGTTRSSVQALHRQTYPGASILDPLAVAFPMPETLDRGLESGTVGAVNYHAGAALEERASPSAGEAAPLLDLAPLLKTLGAEKTFATDLLAALTVDGTLRAVPMTVRPSNTVCYNRAVFERCSVVPPTTLTEFRAAASTLEAVRRNPRRPGQPLALAPQSDRGRGAAAGLGWAQRLPRLLERTFPSR